MIFALMPDTVVFFLSGRKREKNKTCRILRQLTSIAQFKELWFYDYWWVWCWGETRVRTLPKLNCSHTIPFKGLIEIRTFKVKLKENSCFFYPYCKQADVPYKFRFQQKMTQKVTKVKASIISLIIYFILDTNDLLKQFGKLFVLMMMMMYLLMRIIVCKLRD